MKVKDLMNELNKFNPDARFAFDNFEDDVTAEISWSDINGGDEYETAERDIDKEKKEATHVTMELYVNGEKHSAKTGGQEKKRYTYDWPRPMATADGIVWRLNEDKKIEVLLINRKNEPYKGYWALPGGYIEMDETAEDAVLRELEEETGLDYLSGDVEDPKVGKYYDMPNRDPRGRTISFSFTLFCNHPEHVKAGDDASKARWFSLKNLPDLAFDHKVILNDCFGGVL